MQNVTGKGDRKHVYWNSSAIQSMPIRHSHSQAVMLAEIWWEPKASTEIKSSNKTHIAGFSLKLLPQATNCLRPKAQSSAQLPPTQQGRRSLVESMVLLLQCEAENQTGKVSSLLLCVLQKELLAAVVHLLTAEIVFSILSSPAGWKIPSQL